MPYNIKEAVGRRLEDMKKPPVQKVAQGGTRIGSAAPGGIPGNPTGGGATIGSYAPSVFTGKEDYAGSPNNPDSPNYADPMARYDVDYEASINDLTRQRAQAQQQADLARMKDTESTDRFNRSLLQDKDTALDRNRDRLAGQGILRSGIAVEAAGNIGQGYQNRQDEFNRSMLEQSETRESNLANIMQQIQDSIAMAERERALTAQEFEQGRAQQAAQALGAAQQAISTDINALGVPSQHTVQVGGQRYVRLPDGRYEMIG